MQQKDIFKGEKIELILFFSQFLYDSMKNMHIAIQGITIDMYIYQNCLHSFINIVAMAKQSYVYRFR